MELETEIKIKKISRYLYVYAAILTFGVLWNIADGEVESKRDLINGIVRAIGTAYFAKNIWELKSGYWWVIACGSGILAFAGVFSVLLGIVGGIAFTNSTLLFIGVYVLPATAALVMAFYLSIQEDVRKQFTN